MWVYVNFNHSERYVYTFILKGGSILVEGAKRVSKRREKKEKREWNGIDERGMGVGYYIS